MPFCDSFYDPGGGHLLGIVENKYMRSLMERFAQVERGVILRTRQTHFQIDIHSEVIAGATSQPVQSKIILELTRFRSRMTEVIFIVWVRVGDMWSHKSNKGWVDKVLFFAERHNRALFTIFILLPSLLLALELPLP